MDWTVVIVFGLVGLWFVWEFKKTRALGFLIWVLALFLLRVLT